MAGPGTRHHATKHFSASGLLRTVTENGYAERFIRSLKESLLRKCLFTSESALRLALAEFQTYFNHERPHQGIGNCTVLGGSTVPPSTGTVVRLPRVGGLINHYERVA